MQITPRRNHHVAVTRHYLKGFSDIEEENHLWQYTKGKPYLPGREKYRKYSPCLTPLTIAGMERDFYAEVQFNGVIDYESVEIALERLERPAQPVIDKIRNMQLIDAYEKKVLSEYIMLAWKRSKFLRTDPYELMEKTADEQFQKIYSAVEILIAEQPSDQPASETYEKLKKEIEKLEKKFRFDKNMHNKVHNRILFHRFDLMTDHIEKMNWTFGINKTSSPFITSDCPVYFNRHAGLKKSDLTFPISSDIILVASTEKIPYIFTPIQENYVKIFNRRSINLSSEFIFSSINEKWIATMANKPKYHESQLV
jgi:hypothetical protein